MEEDMSWAAAACLAFGPRCLTLPVQSTTTSSTGDTGYDGNQYYRPNKWMCAAISGSALIVSLAVSGPSTNKTQPTTAHSLNAGLYLVPGLLRFKTCSEQIHFRCCSLGNAQCCVTSHCIMDGYISYCNATIRRPLTASPVSPALWIMQCHIDVLAGSSHPCRHISS